LGRLLRKLKKYPNRRLYDTQESCYVTLEDVKVLVLSHEEFQVIDSKSGADITRSILMQIISEQETTDGAPIFSNKMLQQLIRFYGDSLQGVMGEYLEKSLGMFMEQQDILRNQLQSVINANPLKQISIFAEKNIPIIKGIKTKEEKPKPLAPDPTPTKQTRSKKTPKKPTKSSRPAKVTSRKTPK